MVQITTHEEQIVEYTDRIAAMEEELKKVEPWLLLSDLVRGRRGARWFCWPLHVWSRILYDLTLPIYNVESRENLKFTVELQCSVN